MPSNRRVRLSPEAADDLRGILQYTLSTWGRQQRDAYAATLRGAFQNLARFPDLGRAVVGPYADARRHRVGHYVIFYAIGDNEIRVTRILHERMSVSKPPGA